MSAVLAVLVVDGRLVAVLLRHAKVRRGTALRRRRVGVATPGQREQGDQGKYG